MVHNFRLVYFVNLLYNLVINPRSAHVTVEYKEKGEFKDDFQKL